MSNPIHPELIAQLANPADARLSAGSNAKIPWRCPSDPRHIWNAAPNTRRKSRGCPVCQNKLILPGVNDLQTTDPQIARQLVDPADALVTHRGSHAKLAFSCDDHSHPPWVASVVSRTRLRSGCPYCSGRLPVPGHSDLSTTHPLIAAQLVDPEQAKTLGAGSSTALLWQCQQDPAHPPWSAQVRHRVGTDRKKPTSCPTCQNRGQRSTKRLPTLGDLNSPLLGEAVDRDKASKLSSGSGVKLLWHCPDCLGGHDYLMVVKNRVRGQGCPAKAGVLILPGFNDLATTHPDLAAQLVDTSLATSLSRGSTIDTLWQCSKDHQWSTPVYARVAGNGCPQCCPIGSSYGEQALYAAVQALYPDAQHRAKVPRAAGGSAEVDVLAGSLAIEFNGLYWHSEAAGRDSTSHRAKLERLHSAGLRLMTVWEDDWSHLSSRRVILRTIAHKLNATAHLQLAFDSAGCGMVDPQATRRAGARQLQVAHLSGTDAANFFNENHIQGAVAVTRSFALCDNAGRPHAVLGLRSPIHNARAHRPEGHWEIQRYATCGLVPGGFSKLLKHAQSQMLAEGVDLQAWVTLSADESSDGGLYASTGFEIAGRVRPAYWYSGGPLRNSRAPKEAFQLKRFRQDPTLVFEEGFTERQAAEANGLYRIWDAGKTRWIKHLS